LNGGWEFVPGTESKSSSTSKYKTDQGTVIGHVIVADSPGRWIILGTGLINRMWSDDSGKTWILSYQVPHDANRMLIQLKVFGGDSRDTYFDKQYNYNIPYIPGLMAYDRKELSFGENNYGLVVITVTAFENNSQALGSGHISWEPAPGI
jgi:hypothetical protein